MRIVIVTDAWHPQVNGVVTTLSKVGAALAEKGHSVRYVTPADFRTVPCPTYPEIRLALRPGPRLRHIVRTVAPDAIHIATEGPLGWAARAYCLRRKLPFTTAYHTQFPQYVRLRAPIPLRVSYALLRRYHGAASRTLVATESLRQELTERGFRNLSLWSRGVDSTLFRPRDKHYLDLPRPIAMYVGRVAVEKNIEAFLKLELPGSKVVVGDGPDLARLKQAYPDAHFVGYQSGERLAKHVAAADVSVFPSLTDTFGLTMLEAMACGVPVAAYPVTGPKDVVQHGVTGILDTDLAKACQAALQLDGQACIAFAQSRSWDACAEQFLTELEPFRWPEDRPREQPAA
ncbi:alpha-mannosyltransferase [Alkalilimnicola ehrlichii]|uniref:glycosyltransferase family 4 protein n=1 Tax=Alkalilimnicola ehrlichii TaxID=351052 RepID=UPI000E2F97D0|nr:glycosyltransferase family 1 protein [Alkalilimnicola ehrlichii]RFA26811.1 alpha-mannosyltransferase [Alkalilimnicola ehrlichii]